MVVNIAGCGVVVLLLFAATGFAIGIAPARTTLNFSPDQVIPLYVTIINTENRTLFARLYVRGDFADWLQFPLSSASIPPLASSRVDYTLTMPPSLAGPHTYDTRIGAVEAAPDSGMLGAVAGVEAQLYVVAPAGEGLRPGPAPQPNQTGATGSQPELGQPPSAAVLGNLILLIGGLLALTAGLAYFAITQLARRHTRR